jgi:hypothetical protein
VCIHSTYGWSRGSNPLPLKYNIIVHSHSYFLYSLVVLFDNCAATKQIQRQLFGQHVKMNGKQLSLQIQELCCHGSHFKHELMCLASCSVLFCTVMNLPYIFQCVFTAQNKQSRLLFSDSIPALHSPVNLNISFYFPLFGRRKKVIYLAHFQRMQSSHIICVPNSTLLPIYCSALIHINPGQK